MRNEIETKTDGEKILDSIKAFMTSGDVKGGKTQKELTEAKAAILTACMFNGDINKVTIQERLGVLIARMSKAVRKEDEVRYLYTKSKLYEMKQAPNHLRCISEFFHSDEYSVIDSNSRNIIELDGEKYIDIVWVVPTVREQYMLFKQSEAGEKYKTLDSDLTIPSLSFFYHK